MTDLHLANIMATSLGPGIVDAESLGSPPIAARARVRHAPEPAIIVMLDSLLATGLLPIRGATGLPDVSGLFAGAAPVPGILVPRWSPVPGGARLVEMVSSRLVDHGNAPPGASPLQVLP